MEKQQIDLKPGDILFSQSRYHGLCKIKVERLTNTLIVLEGGNIKLRKPFSNGVTAIGSGGYGNTFYYLPTQELEDMYQRKIDDKLISTFAWSKLSNEQIKSVVEFLRQLM